MVRNSAESGLEGRIRHVMIPGIIAEDDDRPIQMKPKLDVLDFWSVAQPELPGIKGLCTQVTAFMDESSLRTRLTELTSAGMEGVVFVGVPRTMNDGEGSGVAGAGVVGGSSGSCCMNGSPGVGTRFITVSCGAIGLPNRPRLL